MKEKHIKKVRDFFRNTPVADLKSVKMMVGGRDYAHQIINNLLKKGEIKRITKGYYSIHDDPVLAAYCFKPCYIGLEEAMSFHGIWEQETSVILVTTKKVRTGMRKVFGANVLIRNISPKYFFGFDYSRYGDFVFPISDVEKTFIDMIYFREIGKGFDKNVLKEFRKRIDRKKLNSYLKKYPEKTRRKILDILNKA
ncbi:MAG: type IV toxin-antitoxin system AbiEi family antitoxin [Candidatus Aenigmatarchaeota archaeon]